MAFCRSRDGAPSVNVHTTDRALLEMTFQDPPATPVPPVGEAAVARMLHTEGTELLHSVHYIGVEDGEIVTPPRRKEPRCVRKIAYLTSPMLRSVLGNEHQEKKDGKLPRRVFPGDAGLKTGFGRLVSGFIEDAQGDLRPQTAEETFLGKFGHATTAGGSLDQT